MDDGADVAFIDTHAVGAGSYEDAIPARHEPGFDGFFFGPLQPCMVKAYFGADTLPQVLREDLRRLPRGTEHNERFVHRCGEPREGVLRAHRSCD